MSKAESERYRGVVGGGLSADYTVLLAENEGRLQRIVGEFDRVCKRRKLKVNARESKVVVFDRAREQVICFAKPYRVKEYRVQRSVGQG